MECARRSGPPALFLAIYGLSAQMGVPAPTMEVGKEKMLWGGGEGFLDVMRPSFPLLPQRRVRGLPFDLTWAQE
jgi:hypothetical protein